MLFFLEINDDPTAEGAGLDYKGAEDYAKGIKDALDASLSFNAYQEFFLKLEDEAVKTSRKLSGSIKGYSKDLEAAMYNVFDRTIKIGGSTQDVVDFAEQYASTTGRVPAILEDQIVQAVKLSKEFGVSTKEIAAMAGSFAQLGLTQTKALEMMKKIGIEARKNMVNAGSLTKVVQENIKKTASYTFKDGIQGLTKMAAQAERLGVKLDSSFSLFDKFMDPDKAIEFASEMQMLGGEFAAQFGDPFSNMGASVEELREKLTKSASSFAEFDAKSGEFKVSREGLKALRILSEQTGESVEDLASVATQSAKEMRIMNEVGFQPEVSEDDRKLLASMAEQKDGKWQVQLPGTKDWVEVSKVNAQNMKNFQDSAQEVISDQSAANINSQLLSTAERQVVALNEIKSALVRQGGLTAGLDVAKSIDGVTSAANTFRTTVLETNATYQTVIGYLKTYQDATITFIKDNLPGIISDILVLESEKVPNTEMGGDMFLPGGGTAPKIMSEGTFYEGISNDQVMVGTDLDKAFELSAEQMQRVRGIASALGTNLENIGDPFKLMLDSVQSKPVTLQNTLGEKPTKLSEVMTTTTNTNINTTNTQNLSGGFTVTIDASKVPNSLDPTMLKNEMMKVMYQLNDEMKKQGVLNFKLK